MTSISIKRTCSKCIEMKSEEDFQSFINKVGCVFRDPWSYDLYLETGQIIENVISTSCNGPSAKNIDELEIEFDENGPASKERKIYTINAVDIIGYCQRRQIKEN